MSNAAVAVKKQLDDRGTGKRALVVEDEGDFRREVSMILTEQGFTVALASNADEAIALARTFRPHLVLMDIRLKGSSKLDGIHAAAVLQDEGLAGRLFFVTAYVDHPGYRQRVADEGIHTAGWLDKRAGRAKIVELVQREEPEMAAAAELDELYDRILDLVGSSAAQPERQRELDPLVRRLRELQQREVKQLALQLHSHRHLKRGTGRQAVEHAHRVLQE